MQELSSTFPDFHSAVEAGEITRESGYHQPHSYGPRQRGCGCDLTTEKGAYRDVTVELPDGRTVHFYHQSAVVVEEPDGRIRLSSHGYNTRTTKQRIKGYLPPGYGIRQVDYQWFVSPPDGDRIEFEDGLVLDP